MMFNRSIASSMTVRYVTLGVAICIAMLLQSCDGSDPAPGSDSNGNINTIAGVAGKFDFSGDGGQALASNLGYLTGITLDNQGNILFVDGAANVVRKIERNSGIISTIAGTFPGGFNVIDPTPYKGDGGAATSAHLNLPLGIATDHDGNIYIVDSGNNVVRKVTITTGIITTIAGKTSHTLGYAGDGGLATAAEFYTPYDIALDIAGNIYVVDSHNHVIRKITASTGIISTVAGSGPDHQGYSGDNGLATLAHLNSPQGIAVDASGNLYIVDSGNHAVRKVESSTGIITTIAGVGIYGYEGDGGAATSALLSAPTRVAVDESGDVYIADQGSHVIRKVSAVTGIITTLAGSGSPGFSGDGGPAPMAKLMSPQAIAVDAQHNVFITDSGNSVIRVVSQ